MGELLTSVESTDKGLVGITQDGQNVPLSAPEPKVRQFQYSRPNNNTQEGYDEWVKSKAEIIVQDSRKEACVQLGEVNPKKVPFEDELVAISYNVYRERGEGK